MRIRLRSAIHVGSCWKIRDRRQIEDTDTTYIEQTSKSKPNNIKYSWTKLATRCTYCTMLQPTRRQMILDSYS